MSGVPFHTTRMGQRFQDHTMPRLVEEIAKLNERLAVIAEALKRAEGKAAGTATETDKPPAGGGEVG